MTVKNILKEPFSHTDVEGIVLEVVNAGESDNLKIIVTQKVIDVIGLTDENLPERVKSWIHQICLPYTA